MIVAITHLKVKNVWKLPLFLKHATASRKSALIAPGNMLVSTKSEGPFVYRTLTVWKDEKALMNYIHSKHHAAAMKKTGSVSNETYSTHWKADYIPNWDEALRMLEASRNPA